MKTSVALLVIGVITFCAWPYAGRAEQSSDTIVLKGDDGSVRSFEIPEEVRAQMSQSAIDDLVDRFDSPACLNAKSVYRGRQSDAKGTFLLRVYDVPSTCAEELNTAMKTFEFRHIGISAFAGGSIDGTTERVRFGYAVDPDNAVIAWEVDLE